MGGFGQVGQPSRRTSPRRPHGLQAGTGDGSSERYRQDPWLKAFPQWNCKMFVDAATTYAVTYPVSRNTSVWADKEADYVNPAFSGEMPVPETARKLATFMNDALAKEKG